MPIDRRYWDSDVFLAWFNNEPGKRDKCLGAIHSAENGELEIITSTLTFAEVLWLKKRPKLDKDASNLIRNFFNQEYIIPVVLDRGIAEYAQDLIWLYNKLKPKDAIHVASALKNKIPIFDTFDNDLIKLSGQLGSPPLKITIPDIPYQGEMFNNKKDE